jgi:glycosyltransferase involved in cell wall biosynthesis
MNNPLISIIVPVYNLESFLPNTVDSIIGQNYHNLEIILVNDGSADGSAEVINHYAQIDPRIKAIHKENGGVTSARLCGVEAATGEWIGFVDGDDYIEPEMYEKLLSNALHYHADISHCGYQMVFNNRVDYYYNTGKLIIQDNVTGLLDLIKGNFVEPGLCNKLYHRKLFSPLSQYMDQSIKINEDLLMNYWLFSNSSSSVFEDMCPYHYIVRKNSAANSVLNENHLYDPLRVTRSMQQHASISLQPLLLERLTRQLISGATMSADSQPELILPFPGNAARNCAPSFPKSWAVSLASR